MCFSLFLWWDFVGNGLEATESEKETCAQFVTCFLHVLESFQVSQRKLYFTECYYVRFMRKGNIFNFLCAYVHNH